MRKLLIGTSALALVACGGTAEQTETPDPAPQETQAAQAPETEAEPTSFAELEGAKAGTYSLETNHAYLSAYVGHGNGLSRYKIDLTDLDATLTFDPASPEASALVFTANTSSVQTNYPGDYKANHADSGHATWNDDVANDDKWLNADTHPTATFRATGATRTGDNTGTITGDLTLLGETNPVTFDVTYNGAGTARGSDRGLLGFSATTTINRSEWGMGAYIPVISDDVRLDFSGEFIQDE